MQTAEGLTQEEQVVQMLRELGVPIHRLGYQQLCIAIPYFRTDSTKTLSKDVYPYVARKSGNISPLAVEHSVREVIHAAYECSNAQVWEKYFPGIQNVPSNKQFIATLAERLK